MIEKYTMCSFSDCCSKFYQSPQLVAILVTNMTFCRPVAILLPLGE